MKNLKSIITSFLLIFSFGLSAQNNGIREAAIKGKSDLIRILSQSKEFNFGVDARQLEASQPAGTIEIFTTDFPSLLNDNSGNITGISRGDGTVIVPLTSDNKVITTVTVASNGKETKAIELVSQQYTTELNDLPAEIKRANFKGLKFIHVPNIEASLYIFADKCYTSYNGKSLREGISITEITRELQIDARTFQTKFGEELKRGKLVR